MTGFAPTSIMRARPSSSRWLSGLIGQRYRPTAPAASAVDVGGHVDKDVRLRRAPATRCEPGPATVSTLPSPVRRPRRNCRRPATDRRGVGERERVVRGTGGRPASSRRSGATNSAKLSWLLTGLPGKQIDRARRGSRADACGPPGCMSTRPDGRAERLEQLADRLVRAHRDAAAREDQFGARGDRPVEDGGQSRRIVAAPARTSMTSAPAAEAAAASAMPFASGSWPVSSGRPGRDELVAGADDGDAHARAHGDVDRGWPPRARRGAARRAAGRPAAGRLRRRGRIPASRTYSPASRPRSDLDRSPSTVRVSSIGTTASAPAARGRPS